MRPTTIIVCGQPLRVESVAKGQPIGDGAREPLTALGCVDLTVQRIGIREGQGAHCERDTLLHEVIHALARLTGAVDSFKDFEEEERAVNALSVGLLDVLRRNPTFTTWLVDQA